MLVFSIVVEFKTRQNTPTFNAIYFVSIFLGAAAVGKRAVANSLTWVSGLGEATSKSGEGGLVLLGAFGQQQQRAAPPTTLCVVENNEPQCHIYIFQT